MPEAEARREPPGKAGAGSGAPRDGAWDEFWAERTPQDEIDCWDFYGGRPWILKHVPRQGTVVEAGAGLGRYVFLLEKLGLDVEGLESNAACVDLARAWGTAHGFRASFRVGDVRRMPFEDGRLAGYISLGVVEHFESGPREPLAEARRVLRPGGVAIVATPAPSFAHAAMGIEARVRSVVRHIQSRPEPTRPFFQHWYSSRQLGRYVREAGLEVVLAGTCDLRYGVWELLSGHGLAVSNRSLAFRVADVLEATPLRGLGAQAFVIAVKPGRRRHCFLCGADHARDALDRGTYLPLCGSCALTGLGRYYHRPVAPRFRSQWRSPSTMTEFVGEGDCHFCGRRCVPDTVFGGHVGFSVRICDACLRLPSVNVVAANELLQPVWADRARSGE